MKQKLCIVLILLVMTCIFAKGTVRRWSQLEVKDSAGHVFALQDEESGCIQLPRMLLF